MVLVWSSLEPGSCVAWNTSVCDASFCLCLIEHRDPQTIIVHLLLSMTISLHVSIYTFVGRSSVWVLQPYADGRSRQKNGPIDERRPLHHGGTGSPSSLSSECYSESRRDSTEYRSISYGKYRVHVAIVKIRCLTHIDGILRTMHYVPTHTPALPGDEIEHRGPEQSL